MAKKKEPNPLEPTTALLCKLGSLIVHADEYLLMGHEFDRNAFDSILDDVEVKEWIKAMNKLALLPVKRLTARRARGE